MTEKLGAGSPFPVVGYDKLANVLVAAYDQSARGKGKERHANDLPFDKQPIMDIARMLPGISGHAYQIMKKAQEASGMAARGELEKAQAELLGVIVYAAAAHVRLDELAFKAKHAESPMKSLRTAPPFTVPNGLTAQLAAAIDPSGA